MGETSAVADEQAAAAAPGDTGAARRAGRRSGARLLVPSYGLLAVALTWPLGLHLGDRLAYGTEPVRTVPLFNLWTLRWNQDRAGHLFRGYWDAPLFHPTTGTFALSEPESLTGAAFAPVSALTGNPVLAFNLVALAFLVLNGWAGARLARHLGAAPGPAALAGVLALALPFALGQAGVLQLTAVFPLLALVDALVRWAPAGGRRPAAEVGLWLAVAFLTCGYYGLFAVACIGPAALALAGRAWLDRARLADALVAAACFVPALPVVVAQARLTAGYERSEDTIRSLSATAGDYLRLEPEATGAGLVPWVGEAGERFALYPGTALAALAVAGAVVAGRAGGAERGLQAFLVAGAALAVLLSLGLNLSVLGVEPYQAVRAVVPGFDSLRSPFRSAVVVQVFLVALAVPALDALWRWRPRPAGVARRAGAWAAVALVALAVLEVGIAPVRLFAVDRSTPDWAAWLDERPQGGPAQRPDVLAFLPFPEDGRAASYAVTVEHMLQVLDAGVTTVNGYSGLWPPAYDRLEAAAVAYPSDEADALLREHGVTLVVADRGWLADHPEAHNWLDARYGRAYVGPDHIVYEPPSPGGARVL